MTHDQSAQHCRSGHTPLHRAFPFSGAPCAA
nr:MAG TPA: hypothetical protein [Caudoviricetes sp.]